MYRRFNIYWKKISFYILFIITYEIFTLLHTIFFRVNHPYVKKIIIKFLFIYMFALKRCYFLENFIKQALQRIQKNKPSISHQWNYRRAKHLEILFLGDKYFSFTYILYT